jgi:hypothetical protein
VREHIGERPHEHPYLAVEGRDPAAGLGKCWDWSA